MPPRQVIVTHFQGDESLQKLETPYSIVYDYPSQKIYWTDFGLGKILHSDVNGSLGSYTPTYLLSFGIRSAPMGIAMDMGGGVPLPPIEAYECFGHGTCGGFEGHFKCSCFDGYFGSCNQSMCPFGPAWFDEPSLANTAHAPAECSNAGLCDRKTGMCECQPGFEGGACELMSCPVDTFGTTCGGHGQCVTMRELAQFATENGDAAPVMYGSSQANATAWDADHIQGCLCDEPGYIGSTQHNRTGYFGYDCSSHQCPVGDYLRTTNQSFEEQAFWCNASSGNFTLR